MSWMRSFTQSGSNLYQLCWFWRCLQCTRAQSWEDCSRCLKLSKICESRRYDTLEFQTLDQERRLLGMQHNMKFNASQKSLFELKGLSDGGRAENMTLRRLAKQAAEPLELDRAWRKYSKSEREQAVSRVIQFFRERYRSRSESFSIMPDKLTDLVFRQRRLSAS
jgi:hypothetical protein